MITIDITISLRNWANAETTPRLLRSLFAECFGSALLSCAVIGSGIAAQRLSPGNVGLELFENAVATAAILYVLILTLRPVSGAHFNPIVTLVSSMTRDLKWANAPAYIGAQIFGCVSGAELANLMFSVHVTSLSTTYRSTGPHVLSEVVATAGLVWVIFSLVRAKQATAVAGAVSAYIGGAYFFTSSTSFANPAITIGRMFTNSFAGIAPGSAPWFIVAQLIGGAVGLVLVLYLLPTSLERTP